MHEPVFLLFLHMFSFVFYCIYESWLMYCREFPLWINSVFILPLNISYPWVFNRFSCKILILLKVSMFFQFMYLYLFLSGCENLDEGRKVWWWTSHNESDCLWKSLWCWYVHLLHFSRLNILHIRSFQLNVYRWVLLAEFTHTK